jgi:hypothetical protein
MNPPASSHESLVSLCFPGTRAASVLLDRIDTCLCPNPLQPARTRWLPTSNKYMRMHSPLPRSSRCNGREQVTRKRGAVQSSWRPLGTAVSLSHLPHSSQDCAEVLLRSRSRICSLAGRTGWLLAYLLMATGWLHSSQLPLN